MLNDYGEEMNDFVAKDLENRIFDRYHAILLGCAIGDILGIPVETFSKEQIKEFYGKIIVPIKAEYVRFGGFFSGKICPIGSVPKDKQRYLFRLGEYSDDTILTLSITESIIDSNGIDMDDIASKHVHEYLSRRSPDGKVAGGFGKTTILALDNIINGISPKHSGVNGLGVGPAMKISPVAIYAHAMGKIGYLSQANDISLMTHTDSRSVVSGIVQAHAIYWLLDINSAQPDDSLGSAELRTRFIDNLCDICQRYEEKTDPSMASPDIKFLDRLEWIKNNIDAEPDMALQYLHNGGASFECHPFAIFMFQKYWDHPIDGLIETVNFGGDADTAGAIYGTLCGAKNGMIFPESLYSPIGEKNLSKIRSLAEGLHSFREQRNG